MNREDGAEGFFLKELHAGVDADENGGFEKICTQVGAGVTSIAEFGTAVHGIFHQIGHAAHVFRTDQRAHVSGRVATGTQAELLGFLDAAGGEFLGNGRFNEEPLD